MPSTRSGASASPGAGAGEDAGQLLEEAAAELSSEVAARWAAEERVAALEALQGRANVRSDRSPLT